MDGVGNVDMSGELEIWAKGGRYGWGVEIPGFPLVGATIGVPICYAHYVNVVF